MMDYYTSQDDNMEVEEQPLAGEEDMGYEDCAPQRRGSMTATEETQRRASIKSIMADNNLSPVAKRRSIQHLMDGRRNSITNSVSSNEQDPSPPRQHASSSNGRGRRHHRTAAAAASTEDDTNEYGYGDAVPDDHNDTTTDYSAIGVTICNEQTRWAEKSRPVCHHYERNCTMVAPCCGAAFGCRICHDDCPALPPKINNGGQRYHRSASLPSSFTTMGNSVPEDNNHAIDRFAVCEIICRECFTRQSSKTNNCVGCSVQFGAYHCDICNLWMSDHESPYHCPDCGFCRVGGQDNFKHCHQCGMCIDKGLYESHNCKAGKYRSNCPVCQEYLFSSRGASHEMPCGHAIHWDCFRQLAAHDSRCPVCKKTAETRERMMPTWDAMAHAVAVQPIPPELARVVSMSCIDCERREDARAWHFLGMQCGQCQSFNTVVDRILLQGEEAHEFLEMNRQRAAILAEQQAQQQQQMEEGNIDGQPNRGFRRTVNRRRSAF